MSEMPKLGEALPEPRLAHGMVIDDDAAARLPDETNQVVDSPLHDVVPHLALEVGRRSREVDEVRALSQEIRRGNRRGRPLEVRRMDEPHAVVHRYRHDVPELGPVLPVREWWREAHGHAVELHLPTLGRLETAVGTHRSPEVAPLGGLVAVDRLARIFRPDLPSGVEGRIRPEVIRVVVTHRHVRGADGVGVDPEAGARQRLLLGRSRVETVPARRQGRARIDEEAERPSLHVGRHRPDAERVGRQRHHAHRCPPAGSPRDVMPGRRQRCA